MGDQITTIKELKEKRRKEITISIVGSILWILFFSVLIVLLMTYILSEPVTSVEGLVFLGFLAMVLLIFIIYMISNIRELKKLPEKIMFACGSFPKAVWLKPGECLNISKALVDVINIKEEETNFTYIFSTDNKKWEDSPGEAKEMLLLNQVFVKATVCDLLVKVYSISTFNKRTSDFII